MDKSKLQELLEKTFDEEQAKVLNEVIDAIADDKLSDVMITYGLFNALINILKDKKILSDDDTSVIINYYNEFMKEEKDDKEKE